MPGNVSKSAKRKLLDDSDSESDDGGAPVEEPAFKVNEEYAKRFEHNKKREEKQRLEEKYSDRNGQNDDDDDSSSTDETEDEEGFLATEDLDAQISATLQAIRNKDPRVYDKKVTFYKGADQDATDAQKQKKEKPVYLTDYHREKILRGDVGESDEEKDDAPMTYSAEQEALRKSVVKEMHATNEDGDSDSDDDDFVLKRKAPKQPDGSGMNRQRAKALKITDHDVEEAHKDPENFLSNFMASRAWLPGDGPQWKAFESDEGEDDDEAEQFEHAYNMRFEDPELSNQVLKSYSRDITAARSVRREDKSGRKRQRELERERKEEEKRERKEEKARLRKLKLEEAEEKLRKVKQAAGASGIDLQDKDWIKFLDDAWDNDKWEEEMNRRFGEDYYAQEDGDVEDGDVGDEDGGEGSKKSKKKHPKKPKWDDDIDIKDIVPDFKEGDEDKPQITLSDDDEEVAAAEEDDQGEEEAGPSRKKRKAADHKRVRIENQKQARQDRTKLEALVDSRLQLTHHDLLAGSADAGDADHGAAAASAAGPVTGAGPFRYRETSPQSFGMTARDILLAPSDAALNEFAGLKKLAAFRDEEKKRRDKKRIGKKARLRQWRREHFGNEFERTGPTYGFEKFADEDDHAGARVVDAEAEEPGKASADAGGENAGADGSRKKKRKRSKGKAAAVS